MMVSLNLFISVVRNTFSYSHTYIRKKVCKSVQTHTQYNIISVKRYTYFSRSSVFSTNISVAEWTQYSKANKTLEKKTTQNDVQISTERPPNKPMKRPHTVILCNITISFVDTLTHFSLLRPYYVRCVFLCTEIGLAHIIFFLRTLKLLCSVDKCTKDYSIECSRIIELNFTNDIYIKMLTWNVSQFFHVSNYVNQRWFKWWKITFWQNQSSFQLRLDVGNNNWDFQYPCTRIELTWCYDFSGNTYKLWFFRKLEKNYDFFFEKRPNTWNFCIHFAECPK